MRSIHFLFIIGNSWNFRVLFKGTLPLGFCKAGQPLLYKPCALSLTRSPSSLKHHKQDKNEILLFSLGCPHLFRFCFSNTENHFESGIRGKIFVCCRGHPSVPLVSSLQNCHISISKDDERKEMGPQGPQETRPNLLFTWALGGRAKGKSSKLGPIFFFSYQCCPCSSQTWRSKPKGFLTHLLSISENGTLITSQVEMLESLLKATAQNTQRPSLVDSNCIFSGRRDAP